MFDEEARKKVYNSLKTKEGIKRFFDKNREKITNDRNGLETSYKELEHDYTLDENLKMAGLAAGMTGIKLAEMVRDTLDILEISFLHRIESQGEFRKLVSILQEKGKNQESKLNELGKKLDKHDPSLEWIDNYFKHSSDTTND